MAETTWTVGDVSGSETLLATDHLYQGHVNELRVAINVLEAIVDPDTENVKLDSTSTSGIVLDINLSPAASSTAQALSITNTSDCTAQMIGLTNAGDDHGVYLINTGTLGSGRYAFMVDSAIAQTSHLVHFRQDHGSTSGNVQLITNDGSGKALSIDANAGNGIYLDSASTKTAMTINITGDFDEYENALLITSDVVFSNATGLLKVRQINATEGIDCPVAFFEQYTNSNAVWIHQVGNGRAFMVDNNNNNVSISIDQDCTVANAAHIVGQYIDMDSASEPTATAYMHALKIAVDCADTDVVECAFNFNGSELTTSDPSFAAQDIWIRCYDDVNNEVFYLRGYTTA